MNTHSIFSLVEDQFLEVDDDAIDSAAWARLDQEKKSWDAFCEAEHITPIDRSHPTVVTLLEKERVAVAEAEARCKALNEHEDAKRAVVIDAVAAFPLLAEVFKDVLNNLDSFRKSARSAESAAYEAGRYLRKGADINF